VLLGKTASVDGSENENPYGAGFSGVIGSPLQYTGAFTDYWTGMVFDQARWYDPGTGPFVSQDPTDQQTLLPHAYAQD
jgi:RHS repeat-associated protein